MPRKIKMLVETGFSGCQHRDETELPENWDELGEKMQAEFLDEVARQYLHLCISASAWVE